MSTLQDHNIRLQQILCCLAEKGNSLANKLKLGIPCECETNNIALVHIYFQILQCYDPEANPISDNCLTQQEVDKIFDHISCLCGTCFFPYGTNYSALAARQGVLLNSQGGRILAVDPLSNNFLINIQ
jgi:hypothetical protein